MGITRFLREKDEWLRRGEYDKRQEDGCSAIEGRSRKERRHEAE